MRIAEGGDGIGALIVSEDEEDVGRRGARGEGGAGTGENGGEQKRRGEQQGLEMRVDHGRNSRRSLLAGESAITGRSARSA